MNSADRSQLYLNKSIWDRRYADGKVMWYPSEILVQLVREQESREGFPGVILDHGAGSGNVAEFLVRSGHKVHCTDISAQSRNMIERRFQDAGLPPPVSTTIDPVAPLAAQLPRYDHVVAWMSLSYNTRDKAIEDIAALIRGLPAGGVFIAAITTLGDYQGTMSDALPDGSRRLKAAGQEGAVIALATDTEEFLSWCPGLDIRDSLLYRLAGRQFVHEFAVVYGVKS